MKSDHLVNLTESLSAAEWVNPVNPVKSPLVVQSFVSATPELRIGVLRVLRLSAAKSVLALGSARLLVNKFAKSPENKEKPMTFMARLAHELACERHAQLRKERKRVKPSPKSAETCKPDIGATNA